MLLTMPYVLACPAYTSFSQDFCPRLPRLRHWPTLLAASAAREQRGMAARLPVVLVAACYARGLLRACSGLCLRGMTESSFLNRGILVLSFAEVFATLTKFTRATEESLSPGALHFSNCLGAWVPLVPGVRSGFPASRVMTQPGVPSVPDVC